LDNFKFFNDNFGHALGDKILELTANLFQEAVRTTDLVFRYGGDEFVIVLPETSEDGARELANRILKKFTEVQSFRTVLEELYAHNFTIPQDKQLSCSIGIATYTGTPVPHTDYQAFLNQADNNLYQAKVQGRNQAV
jgi:diguanylate cyclase (GGDEF)-like protein